MTAFRRRLAARLDAIALQQLREVAARQTEQIDELRRKVEDAERCAEFWRENADQLQDALCERTGGHPGLTRAGELVVVAPN